MTMTSQPGISAAEHHHLLGGAKEFLLRQAGVLAEFLRREGGDTLSGDFAALAGPAARVAAPGRDVYNKRDGSHFMWMITGGRDHHDLVEGDHHMMHQTGLAEVAAGMPGPHAG
jgi:hypothetical protein